MLSIFWLGKGADLTQDGRAFKCIFIQEDEFVKNSSRMSKFCKIARLLAKLLYMYIFFFMYVLLIIDYTNYSFNAHQD